MYPTQYIDCFHGIENIEPGKTDAGEAIDPDEIAKPDDVEPDAAAKKIEKLLASVGIAYDINAYKAAPTGFRIWCGPTVATADVKLCIEWLEWGYEQVMGQ